MSWASMLEDAITRFENDMHMITKSMPSEPTKVPIQEWRSVAGLLARGERILVEAVNYLELATDPTIDLAKELDCSISEAHDLRVKVSEFQRTSLSLASALKDREAELKELKQNCKELKVENNQLSKKLDQAMKGDPGSIYDQFMKGANSKKR